MIHETCKGGVLIFGYVVKLLVVVRLLKSFKAMQSSHKKLLASNYEKSKYSKTSGNADKCLFLEIMYRSFKILQDIIFHILQKKAINSESVYFSPRYGV